MIPLHLRPRPGGSFGNEVGQGSLLPDAAETAGNSSSLYSIHAHLSHHLPFGLGLLLQGPIAPRPPVIDARVAWPRNAL